MPNTFLFFHFLTKITDFTIFSAWTLHQNNIFFFFLFSLSYNASLIFIGFTQLGGNSTHPKHVTKRIPDVGCCRCIRSYLGNHWHIIAPLTFLWNVAYFVWCEVTPWHRVCHKWSCYGCFHHFMSISYISAASSSFLCECKVFYSHSRSDSNPKKKRKIIETK